MVLLVFQNWKGKIDFPLFCCFQPFETEGFALTATLTHIPCTFVLAAVGNPSHLITTECYASISALHAGTALVQPFPFLSWQVFSGDEATNPFIPCSRRQRYSKGQALRASQPSLILISSPGTGRSGESACGHLTAGWSNLFLRLKNFLQSVLLYHHDE